MPLDILSYLSKAVNVLKNENRPLDKSHAVGYNTDIEGAAVSGCSVMEMFLKKHRHLGTGGVS